MYRTVVERLYTLRKAVSRVSFVHVDDGDSLGRAALGELYGLNLAFWGGASGLLAVYPLSNI